MNRHGAPDIRTSPPIPWGRRVGRVAVASAAGTALVYVVVGAFMAQPEPRPRKVDPDEALGAERARIEHEQGNFVVGGERWP